MLLIFIVLTVLFPRLQKNPQNPRFENTSIFVAKKKGVQFLIFEELKKLVDDTDEDKQ